MLNLLRRLDIGLRIDLTNCILILNRVKFPPFEWISIWAGFCGSRFFYFQGPENLTDLSVWGEFFYNSFVVRWFRGKFEDLLSVGWAK